MSVFKKSFLARTLAVGVLSLSTLFGGAAHAADDYPNRPIRLVVPFVAGGVTDAAARVVAERLGRELGQTVVVENKPGAGGNIGTAGVARANPDGYTLLLAYDGTLAINPNVYDKSKVPFDTLKDFDSVGKIGDALLVIVANPKIEVNSFAELKKYASEQQHEVFFGTAGAGSTPHLAGALLSQHTGIPLSHVAYKGGSAALADVAGGVLPLSYAAVAGAMPFIQGGQVRALAVTSAQRAPSLPDVPTLIEEGVDDFVFNSWVGLMTPAGTPKPVITKLNEALQNVLKQDDVKERLAGLGVVATPGSPESFHEEVARELDRIADIVRTANIKLD